MKKSGNILGILYFFIHFIIEITSFYILSSYTNSNIIWLIALLYDFYAFVPQGIYGYLADKGIKVNLSIVGLILSSIALILFGFNINAFIVVLTIAIGNSLIHVQGAETTLRSSKGRMSPSAIFVAGGSFGLITGKLLAMYKVPVLIVLIINLLMIIPIIICNKYKSQLDDKNLESYNYSNKKIAPKVVITLAVLVVVIRSYMGYGIPTSWNKTLVQTIMLYCFMGTGKALGGILIDAIGVRKTALLSTIGALPFLLFGNNVMTISLIGIMLFSMTMAITLGLIVSNFTTLGLFLGTVPIFVFRVSSILVNCIIVIVLTLVSVIILNKICKKEVK